jgi:hypothetical protein
MIFEFFVIMCVLYSRKRSVEIVESESSSGRILY